MSIVTERADLSLDDPFLVEGLPGLGLVGKIAADYLIEQLDMTYYASVDAEYLPPVVLFEGETRDLRPPVRIYADETHDLLVLRSDVVLYPEMDEFVHGMVDWLGETGTTPLFLSGLPSMRDDASELWGVATGNAGTHLDDADIPAPPGGGAVSGPTGALLRRAYETDLDGLGLIIETDPQFPDPAAARTLIDSGIEPVTGVDVDTAPLMQKAEEIRDQKEQLAQAIRQAEEEQRSQTIPEEWYS